jgi:hypothetical protein
MISRYANTPVTDGTFYSTVSFPSQKDLDKIDTYSVILNKFDRLDNLAAKYFGDGSLWWVLAVMNNLQWAWGFNEGQTLIVPVNVQDVLKLF